MRVQPHMLPRRIVVNVVVAHTLQRAVQPDGEVRVVHDRSRGDGDDGQCRAAGVAADGLRDADFDAEVKGGGGGGVRRGGRGGGGGG